jgi:multicomponent Na+:H+ antiporter subunit B
MIKRAAAFVVIALLAVLLYELLAGWSSAESLNDLAGGYVDREPRELGAANIVTAIIVTYRGLDTLGEVAVLFLAATGVGLLLRKRRTTSDRPPRHASEILTTGARYLVPVIVMFGAYIFLNGHLSPGGGFQGGAVAASAVLLIFLAHPGYALTHGLLRVIESLSGAFYVLIGILGLILAGGFLDSRFLPLGEFGTLLSAGAIPVIYVFIGLKVGTELAGILGSMRGSEE